MASAKKKLTTNEKVIERLRDNLDQKFTAKEIAEWIFEIYQDDARKKQQESKATVFPLDSDEAVIGAYAAEISSGRPQLQKREPKIRITTDRPRKYYYTKSSNNAEDHTEGNSKPDSTDHKESDLYPKLAEFLWSEFKVRSKRIEESVSSKKLGKGANYWLHPDIVGMEVQGRDWSKEVEELASLHYNRGTTLWSFEVKSKIDIHSLRKSFFQSVSNSSWANYGYLVAKELDDQALPDLRTLSASHGIGFILLNFDNPSESGIMLHAKYRPEVDWGAVNRLAGQNDHFKGYIQNIIEVEKSGNPDLYFENWFPISDPEG